VNPRGLKPAARNTEAGNALAGRRVVITRSTSSLHELRARLTAAGAITIEAPMIRIAYPANPDGLDPAIADLGSYGWVAFASVHGVRGFFEGLATLGQDARALAPCKVAAIGPITASALRKRGIHADLVAKPYSASALIAGVRADIGSRPSRILCPCGDVAPTEMSQGMRQAGLAVDEVATYCTITLTLPESVLRAIGEGVDAILLCSPSAARRFGTLNLNLAGAAVACIGPSTASAARAAGMPVDVIAEDHTDGGLVAALAQRFGSDREGNWGPPSPADRNTTSKKSTSTTSRKRAPRSCST
ncbi:MAG: uroporphyrinogen-III synthase, partial [Planctomycetes bacterium]|nr:uroporphyrinogen-III synthase [Planctomycetota bacterium]